MLKYLPGLTVCLLVTGCVTTPAAVKLTPKAMPTYPVEVSPQALQEHVQALTSLQPPRSAANVASLDAAAAYIRDRLLAMGYGSVLEQRFDVDGNTYRNVLVRYGTAGRPRLVIGAHYDVAGNLPGADDNASGVAGLLELARLVATNRPVLDYELELVAYSLEEPPHFGQPTMGSAFHARSLTQARTPVRFMISLEMIGYFSDQPGSQEIPPLVTRAPLPTTGNFIAVVGRTGGTDPVAAVAQAMRFGANLDVQALSAPRMLGAGLSDHVNYWDQGYPAVMITDTSFYRNKNYHKPTDTPDTLDYARMAEVVEGVYYVVVAL